MKTKRRHELQTNELADWLGHQIETVKPYRQYIVGGILLIAVLVAFVLYQASGRREAKAAAWREYYSALSERRPEQLDAVAQAYPDSNASVLALQAAADIYLEEGSRLVYTDRETANDTLKRAVHNFEQVLQRAEDGFLQSRAQLGLAQALESLNELEQAKEHYRRLADDSSDPVIAQLASRSIQRLEDSQTVDVFRQLSGEIIDPAKEYPDLPERPDLSFPGDATALADWPANGQLILEDETEADDDQAADAATSTDDRQQPVDPQGEAAPDEDSTSATDPTAADDGQSP